MTPTVRIPLHVKSMSVFCTVYVTVSTFLSTPRSLFVRIPPYRPHICVEPDWLAPCFLGSSCFPHADRQDPIARRLALYELTETADEDARQGVR